MKATIEMSRLLRARIRLFLAFVALTTASGFCYAVYVEGLNDPRARTYVTVGWAIGAALVWAFEIFVIPGRLGIVVRRLHFLSAIGLKSLLTIAIIIFDIWFLRVVSGQSPSLSFVVSSDFREVVIVTLAVIVLLQTASQVARIVGPGTLVQFVLGRYASPVRESTIFMFLDLANSTALAERFGDIGVQRMITRFFIGITEPILEFGGTVHRYVGDQVVVTWPLKPPEQNVRPILCAFAIRDFIAARASSFESEFGAVPEFRIGLHGGSVVISQIGDRKQELSYFGDTVNTAARIEARCKDAGKWLLISADLLQQAVLPEGISEEFVESVQLRGRAKEIELYTLMRE